ncbi:hypothetical protein OIU77_018236 [Salix suchowensis]|uniref:Uncharacterized protein n=1 Tax=Salix suchowensis TaxID=1278906 RepID=A0ABQ8ZRN8_9ROSI|nr:hypothetical protein OIU77_018236 [Salix suchowensis]
MEVNVLRAGKLLKITALDLVIGDIVSLEGDALFRVMVIEGEGNMLVTSMGLNTTLGEMISKASERRLPVQLRKVTNRTEIAGLATSILIMVVLFLRFKLGKEIKDSSMPEFKGQQKTKDVMEFIKRIVWKPNGKIRMNMESLKRSYTISEIKELSHGDEGNGVLVREKEVLTVVLQVVFIEISHDIFGLSRLNGPQWGICFLIGALSCVTDGAVNITWGFIKVKLTRSSSLGGSELP